VTEETEELASSPPEGSRETERESDTEGAPLDADSAYTDQNVEHADRSAERSVDTAAESFVAVEDDLAPADESGRVWGRAVDVDRVSASAVPEGYPVEIETDRALALELAVEGERVTAYFALGDDLTGTRLGGLLALKGISPERFADLHGESLLLELRDGHYVPVVPSESPRGSPRGVYGVVAGLGMNLLFALLAIVGLGSVFSTPVVLAWMVANVVGLPVATYTDAWHLRTHTDWEGGPLFWATLGALPGLNVLSSAWYLRDRGKAKRLG